jgi:ABC-type spermidine/putrescine transport system permease subunit II
MALSALAGGPGRRRVPFWRVLLYVWCALVFAFLVAPLIVVFPISFSSSAYLQFPPPGWSLRWYQAFFGDPAWIDSTLRSLKIAAWVTAASILVGTPLALSLIRGRYPGKALLEQLANAPLVVPSIVFAIAVYGAFAKARLIGDWRGIVIAHTVHAIPYVVIVVGSALKTVDVALEHAAMGLGASRFGALWRVTLPQIRPAIVSAMFLAFISSFDELVVAMFLGGSNMTLPKKMFDNILNAVDPTIAAVSVIQIVLVCVALALAHRFGSGAQPAGLR